MCSFACVWFFFYGWGTDDDDDLLVLYSALLQLMSENSVQNFNVQLAWLGEVLHEVTDLQFQERMAQCAAELDSSSIKLKIQGFLEKLQHIKQEQARANNVGAVVLSSFFLLFGYTDGIVVCILPRWML